MGLGPNFLPIVLTLLLTDWVHIPFNCLVFFVSQRLIVMERQQSTTQHNPLTFAFGLGRRMNQARSGGGGARAVRGAAARARAAGGGGGGRRRGGGAGGGGDGARRGG